MASTPALPRRRSSRLVQVNRVRYICAVACLIITVWVLCTWTFDWHGLTPRLAYDARHRDHDPALIAALFAGTVFCMGVFWPIQAAWRSVHPRQ